MHEPSGTQPVLLNALGLDGSDIGSFEWNRTHNTDRLSVTNEGLTIEWDQRKSPPKEERPPMWIPTSTCSVSLADRTLQCRWDLVASHRSAARCSRSSGCLSAAGRAARDARCLRADREWREWWPMD